MSATDSAAVPLQATPEDSVRLDPAPDDVLQVEPSALACPYCASPIDRLRFTAWPFQPRLISGTCEACGRDVTLPSRWLTTPAPARQHP